MRGLYRCAVIDLQSKNDFWLAVVISKLYDVPPADIYLGRIN